MYRVVRRTQDIVCSDGETYCHKPKWRNNAWRGNNVPGLNTYNPVMKDTVQLPTGGYAVIRFKADNPGIFYTIYRIVKQKNVKWYFAACVQKVILFTFRALSKRM